MDGHGYGGGGRGGAISELCVGANRELRGVTASGTFTHVVQDGGNR